MFINNSSSQVSAAFLATEVCVKVILINIIWELVDCFCLSFCPGVLVHDFFFTSFYHDGISDCQH